MNTRSREEFAAVFWARVDRSGECWTWLGRVAGKGYGQITSKWFTTEIAHRIAYELAVGSVPDGMLVCHTCDNRLCCRPDHLFIGTDQDNVLDMIRKGRSPRLGSFNPSARLNAAQVAQIKRAFLRGETDAALGARYGVSAANINCIRRGVTWTHVEIAA